MTASPTNVAEPPPLWIPVLACASTPGLVVGAYAMTIGRSSGAAVAAVIFVSLIAFAHTLFFGVPWAYWMHSIGRFRLWPMVLGGFLVGGIPFGLLLASSAVAFLVFGAFGAIGALAFYAVSCLLSRSNRTKSIASAGR